MYWSSLNRRSSHARVADRAEEDRVLPPQQVEAARGNDLAGFQVAIAAPVERLHLVGDALEFRDRRQHLHRLGGDLGARAVSGNRGNRKRTSGHGIDAPGR
jgi:hypothetical protein